MIGYLDEVIRPLVLIIPKISGYVKTLKDKGRDKNKNKKLMPLGIDNDKLLNKYKTIWANIEDLQIIELDALPVHDRRYRKIKIGTYGDFRGFIVPEDGVECESFMVSSVDSLLIHGGKYYIQVYLDNCAYKIVDKKMKDYLDENLFETDKD